MEIYSEITKTTLKENKVGGLIGFQDIVYSYSSQDSVVLA